MRRKQNQINDRTIIEEILSRSQVCRIAMIDNGRPYIVPLNYGYKENALFFHSAPLGRKIELLENDSKVCFEIEYLAEIIKNEIPCEWGAKYRSVIGYGNIVFLKDPLKKKEGLDIIMAHYGKTDRNIFQDNHLENVVVLKLIIEEITGKQSGNWD